MLTDAEEDEVFPAPAGVILNAIVHAISSIGFPRTCGGDPKHYAMQFSLQRFSPHLRG